MYNLYFLIGNYFFGNTKCIKKVGFENRRNLEIIKQDDYIIISLKYCINFIEERFAELTSIKNDLRGSGMLSKEGSLALSEEFLLILIFLEKLKDTNF